MEKQHKNNNKLNNKNEIRVRLNNINLNYKNKDISEIPIEVKLAYVKMLFVQFIDKVSKESIVDSFYTDDIKLLVVDYLDASSLLWSDSEYGEEPDEGSGKGFDDGFYDCYRIDLLGDF